MTQVPIKINVNLYFAPNWDGETSRNFTHSFKWQNVSISNDNVYIILILI